MEGDNFAMTVRVDVPKSMFRFRPIVSQMDQGQQHAATMFGIFVHKDCESY